MKITSWSGKFGITLRTEKAEPVLAMLDFLISRSFDLGNLSERSWASRGVRRATCGSDLFGGIRIYLLKWKKKNQAFYIFFFFLLRKHFEDVLKQWAHSLHFNEFISYVEYGRIENNRVKWEKKRRKSNEKGLRGLPMNIKMNLWV